jgi:large subunit ribosomal protein L9
MEVILLKDMGTLGDKHEVVQVKAGYGRNYLIPKGIAIIANKPNMKKLDDIVAREKADEEKRLDEFKETIAKIDGQTLKIGVKAGTSGKIFGSVTAIQVINALKEQLGVEIPRRKVGITDEMKEVGSYPVKVTLHPQAVGTITLDLVKE